MVNYKHSSPFAGFYRHGLLQPLVSTRGLRCEASHEMYVFFPSISRKSRNQVNLGSDKK